MTADQFRAALCFRSLVPFFRKAQECWCGKELDIFGYHALSCQGPENLTFSRHEILCGSVIDLALRYGFHAEKNAKVECLGLSDRYGIRRLRPADVLISRDGVNSACVDVTVGSPLSDAKSSTSEGKFIGHSAIVSSNRKDKKHKLPCEQKSGNYSFLAFAADVCGVLTKDAYGLLQQFARHGKEPSRRPLLISFCRRKISLALQLGVSNQFLIRASFPSGTYKDGDAVQLIGSSL